MGNKQWDFNRWYYDITYYDITYCLLYREQTTKGEVSKARKKLKDISIIKNGEDSLN